MYSTRTLYKYVIIIITIGIIEVRIDATNTKHNEQRWIRF